MCVICLIMILNLIIFSFVFGAYLEVFIMPLWFLLESSHSCGIWQNPVELFLAESPAKIAIPGTIYSGRIEPFQNWDWNGPEQNPVEFCLH